LAVIARNEATKLSRGRKRAVVTPRLLRSARNDTRPCKLRRLRVGSADAVRGNRCNHVNRIFTVFDEDRSPDDSDGISIELPMQLIRDSAMALQPELTPDWMAHGSE